jgi:hypothetical protein
MHIELDDVTAMQIRVTLAVAATRWDESAQNYSGSNQRVAKMFADKADTAFKLMNEFRVATGYDPYTIEYIRGDR